MKLTMKTEDDLTILNISGELNADTVEKFNQAVLDAFAAKRCDFIVNMEGLTIIDSKGLEAFTALVRQAEEQLGMVKFCGANQTLQKVFEITRLDKQLCLYENIEESLASFSTS